MESIIEIVCEFLKYLINTITSMSWQIFAFFVLFIFKDSLIDFLSKIKNIHAIGFSFDSDIQQQSIDSIQNNSNPSSDGLSNSKPCNNKDHEEYKTAKDILILNYDKVDKNTVIKYLEFEKIYQHIYGSQINLLNIHRNIKNEITPNAIETYLNQYKSLYTNLQWFQNLQPAQFVEFLILWKLISILPNGNYKIEDKGFEFINYIFNCGYNFNKPF